MEESKEEDVSSAIPASLRMDVTLPPEYLVRCEGTSDDNVTLVTLLDREGIMCGPDGEDTPGPLTFAKVRNVAREKLWQILSDPEMTRETERGILEETIRQAYTHNLPRVWKNKVVKEIYKTLYAKVWRNLLPEDHPQSVGNPKLLGHVKSGLIDAKSLAALSPQKMWPEKWRDLEEARILKQIATLERSVTASTDMFTCGRCGKNECTYREVQTRSADEPMTAFVLCLVCGNRWKE
jgi:transcription elongation factor S-II